MVLLYCRWFIRVLTFWCSPFPPKRALRAPFRPALYFSNSKCFSRIETNSCTMNKTSLTLSPNGDDHDDTAEFCHSNVYITTYLLTFNPEFHNPYKWKWFRIIIPTNIIPSIQIPSEPKVFREACLMQRNSRANRNSCFPEVECWIAETFQQNISHYYSLQWIARL